MPIKEIFDLIDNYVSEKGVKIVKEEALYKEEAPIESIARGRFCQRCSFFSSEERGDYCSLLGECSDGGSCRLFYGVLEDTNRIPYSPVVDAVKLEDGYIAIPVLQKGTNIIINNSPYNITKDTLDKLFIEEFNVRYNGKKISVESKDIEEDILFIILKLAALNNNNDLKVIKIYFNPDNEFILESLDPKDQEDLSYPNLSLIAIIP